MKRRTQTTSVHSGMLLVQIVDSTVVFIFNFFIDFTSYHTVSVGTKLQTFVFPRMKTSVSCYKVLQNLIATSWFCQMTVMSKRGANWEMFSFLSRNNTTTLLTVLTCYHSVCSVLCSMLQSV